MKKEHEELIIEHTKCTIQNTSKTKELRKYNSFITGVSKGQ